MKSNIEILTDGHDSITFDANDVETFGALVTNDAVTALDKICRLARALLDAQASDDTAKAAKILDELHNYFLDQ